MLNKWLKRKITEALETNEIVLCPEENRKEQKELFKMMDIIERVELYHSWCDPTTVGNVTKGMTVWLWIKIFFWRRCYWMGPPVFHLTPRAHSSMCNLPGTIVHSHGHLKWKGLRILVSHYFHYKIRIKYLFDHMGYALIPDSVIKVP